MLYPRIIPCLLLKKDNVYNTLNFNKLTYIGDPINSVRIFNEKKADEILILDIDASSENNEPNYKLISILAKETRMPINYGGGIKNIDQASKIFHHGVEKINLSSVIFTKFKIVSELVKIYGSQSITVTLDVKKKIKQNVYEIYYNNGKIRAEENIFALVSKLEDSGIGELIINNIDNDGTMRGLDLDLIKLIYNKINLPLTVMGGLKDISELRNTFMIFKDISIAGSSIFLYKGKLNAVLLNYPSNEEKQFIFSKI